MTCKHTDQIKIRTTDKHECEECVKLGDTWVHLRLCLSCGNLIEPGESWVWCYVDKMSPGELGAA